jgi:hypothetical protein
MNLDQALPSLAWKVAERGPLLVVGADKVQVPDLQHRMEKGALPPVPPLNTPAKTIAELFEYKVEKVGTLHVLAPAKIRQFRGAPAIDPASAAPLEHYELSEELGQSLTRTQWAALVSPRGLGRDDLTPKQQALFLALLPDPMRLRPTTPRPDGSREAVELTPEQRAQVRFRMDRHIRLSFMSEGDSFSIVRFGEGPDQKPPPFYLESDHELRTESQYEQIAPLVPNRLKPGDLDFDSPQLDPYLPFAGLTHVEELVQKLRDVTGLKVVLADARLGSLSVKVRGESARAGDVLQALCRAVGGAVRKVGNGAEALYVLTDDRIGLGTRMASFEEWRSDVSNGRWRSKDKRGKELEDIDFSGTTSLDDPYNLPPETLAAIEKSRWQLWDPGKADSRGVAVSSLPPALQAQVQQTLEKQSSFKYHTEAGEIEQTLRRDRVDLLPDYRVQMVIPGWGVTEYHALWGLIDLPRNIDAMRYNRNNPPRPEEQKPLRYPPAWRVRGLILQPKDAAESRTLAGLAKENGFNVLWVAVPLDAAKARPILEAAQSAKLPVVALVHLLQVPPTAIPPGAQPDISLLGESSIQGAERQRLRSQRMNPEAAFPPPPEPLVYLSPTPATQKLLIDRAAAVAAIPGLAGLALRSVTPPGYEPLNPSFSMGVPGLGYTLDNRLAFLKKESIDPIDLVSQYSDSRLVSPFFQSNGPGYIPLPNGQYDPDPKWRDRHKLWRELLGERIGSLKKTLFARLRTAAPTLPLWLNPDEAISMGGVGGFYGLWEKPEAKLVRVGDPWEQKAQLARARSFTSRALTQLMMPWRDDKKKIDAVNWRSYMVRQMKTAVPGGFDWSGFLVDASQASAADLSEFLPLFKEDPP